MEAPDFSGQPWWAYGIFLAFMGIAYAVMRWGEKSGRARRINSDNSAEVVALSIDSRALDRLTGEISGLAVVGTKLAGLVEAYITAKEQDRAEEDFDEAVSRKVAEERAMERSSRQVEEEVSRRVAAELERLEAVKRRPPRA